jgi:hypothetical protein
MTKKERILRLLTIKPTDLSRWTRFCRQINSQIAAAHPNYPRLDEMQVLSYVKRMLPEIRAMIVRMDADAEKSDGG